MFSRLLKKKKETPDTATETGQGIANAHGAGGENVHQALTLKGFLQNSPIAIALLDRQGTILEANTAFLTLIGHPEAPKNAWHLEDTVAAEDRAALHTLLEEACDGGVSSHSRPLEVKIAGERGATASLYLTNVGGKTEEGPCLMAHMIDLTEQKNLEVRFAHSQKMQAVGQLAGGIAHDFNNLLTAMIGFCDLLLMRHPAGDQSFADIMQIKQNANRAANLVRQLLAFSRRQTLQPKVLDLTDVLADISDLVRRLIGENIELKMNHGRDLWPVKVDQGQLEQVLINLAVNARDAMTDGGVLSIRTSNVTIDAQHRPGRDMISPADEDEITDGEYVLVEMADTGHGMKPEMIRQIFEPFFSTKEIGSGTGLGLATVYGIVKQTGGYIYVKSSEGEGTTFSIYFRRFVEDRKEAGKAAAVAEDAAEAAADLTGKGTILLVEDEAAVRMFSARALRNKGYHVLEADCGEQALELVAEHGSDIEVIVSDVIMPGINGPAMVEEIHKSHPNIKVIFISGYAEDAFMGAGDEKEINFLPKPFTLKQLAARVKEVAGE